MKKIFRWGIVGPGLIADTYAQGLKGAEGSEIAAVGGRNMEKVNAFADKYQIPVRYNSYDDVINDTSVDAIYIALPNHLHREYAKKAIDAGKAVLCEKPMAMNVTEAQELADYAREKQVFLMEAVWSRFLPIYKQVKQWIADGQIGEISMIREEFAFNVPWEAGDRHINPQMGGGALMDVGVYLIACANDILGESPTQVVSKAVIDGTGVDVKNSFIMSYDSGKLVTCVSSVITDVPNDCYIYGSKGYIHMKNFWRADSAILCISGEEPVIAKMPFKENGYEGEAREVMECVQSGKIESKRMTLDESIAISKIITDMRYGWGLKFPMEG